MERSYSRYLLVVLCIAIVATALILVALNAFTMSRNPGSAFVGNLTSRSASDEELAAAYRDGFNDARQRLSAQNPETLSAQTNVVMGSIVNTSAGSIIVKQENLAIEPKTSGISDDRTVLISGETKIYRNEPKSAATLQAEIDAFEANGSADAEPPTASTRVELTLSDLKVGDRVHVTASDDDVTSLKEIHALEIVVSSPVTE